jgi:hypothetical protein
VNLLWTFSLYFRYSVGREDVPMADSKVITDQDDMTAEDWAGIMEGDEPSEDEMALSNASDARFLADQPPQIDPDAEEEKELLD